MAQRSTESERDSAAPQVVAAYAAAQGHRRSQLKIRARYLREFMDLWPVLNKASSSDDVARWLRLNVALVRRWQQPSRALAVEFYRSQHMAQLGRPAALKTAPEMPAEQITRNLLGRGPGVLRRLEAKGLTELIAEERAQAAAAASGSRMVLAGGRQALEVQTALGFMRVTDGDPCYFCAMLASRGAVYQTAGTAGREANDRFAGEGLFKFHDDCGCSILPIFSRTDFMSDEASRYRAIWDATYGKTGKTHAGNEVTGIDFFRAVIERRADLPN